MGGASSYLAMLAIAGFLFASWLATKVSRLAGVSSIVLEITTGVVFGPGVLGLVSPEYAECEHKRHMDCAVPADLDALAAKGASFGDTLDGIASMGYCDYWAHGAHHTEDHGDGGHGADHADGGKHGSEHSGKAPPGDDAHGDTGAAHAPPNDHKSPHGGAAAPHDAPEDPTHQTPPLESEEPQVDQEARGAAAQAAQDDDQGDGGMHRRLSGGGGGGAQYTSYAECLEKSCLSEVSHHCGLTPDVFTLIGHAGVALMIFESGMHFDFEKAQTVGPKACAVAVLGTILPLITGTVLTVIFGKPFVPDGVSVGTALAPTSVGIALRLLGEAGVLSHDFGQAIITAAFVDDILSLVLFNVLFSLKGEFDMFKVVWSPIIGIIFMLGAMLAAVKFWPRAIAYILQKVPIKRGDPKVSSSDEALFLIMFALLVVYATATHFLGTHLWGCFIAGMSFACVKPMHHPHHVWVKQTKRITSWMIRIFFAATVAFSIPVDKLLSIDAFLKGSLMGIFPCILTKVFCAPFMGDAKFVIGWAMVGRAEFAYLIAQMAAAGNMIDQETFSITIWALLYATIFAPFIFRTVLRRYIERNGLNTAPSELGDNEEDEEKVLDVPADKGVDTAEGAASTYGRGIDDLLSDIKLQVGDGAAAAPGVTANGGRCGVGLLRWFACGGGAGGCSAGTNAFSR